MRMMSGRGDRFCAGRTGTPLCYLLVAFLAVVALSLPQRADALTDDQFLAKVNECSEHNEENPMDGIALMGSSSFARWTDAPEDFERLTEDTHWAIDADLIYNFGVAGSTSRQWTMETYLDAIVAKHPSVVAIYGTNRLGAKPLNGAISAKLVRSSIRQLSQCIDYIRTKCTEEMGFAPSIVLISGVKTPNAYRRSKHITLTQDIADVQGGYCIAWNRIDAYNAELRGLSTKYAEVFYCDIEQYYYKIVHGTVQYRLDKDEANAGTATANDIISGRVKSNYLEKDMLHPTKTAYEQIWEQVIRETATRWLRMRRLYDLPKHGEPVA